MISDKFTERSKAIPYPSEKMPHALYLEAKRKYNENMRNINKEFELTLYKQYGVENNPKREKAFSVAWIMGHSSGFSEVESVFIELLELIK
jgi:hypothetical protein